jgi:hypothetical protein
VKWVVPIGIVGLIIITFLIHGYAGLVTMTTSAEAEAFDVVAESVAQMVCAIGQQNGVIYGDYDANTVGDVVFDISQIPLDEWNNNLLPYIKEKYTKAGIPVELRFIKTDGSNPTLKPVGLGNHIYTLEVYFLKLKTYRYWRIGAIVVKTSSSGKHGQYRCITVKY